MSSKFCINALEFLFWKWYETSYSGGHAFIVDGYCNLSCVATKGTNTINITTDFIHCNTGWGGVGNGYYISGVFNMGAGALANDTTIPRSVTYGTNHYYKYRLTQFKMLRPKR